MQFAVKQGAASWVSRIDIGSLGEENGAELGGTVFPRVSGCGRVGERVLSEGMAVDFQGEGAGLGRLGVVFGERMKEAREDAREMVWLVHLLSL